MNFKEILTNIAKAIVDEPDAVNVAEVVDGDDTSLTAQLDEKNNELLEQMELWETTQLELEELTSENGG